MKALLATLMIATASTAAAGEICLEGQKFSFGPASVSIAYVQDVATAEISHSGGTCFVSPDGSSSGSCDSVDFQHIGPCSGSTSGNKSPIITGNQGDVTINFD